MHSRAARWSLVGLLVMLALPWLLPQLLPANQAQFWTANILGRALVFGIVAMSLTFLATYGGFVSLAQMMVAGTAGYALAIFVEGAVPRMVGGFGYAAAIPLGLLAATAMGLLVGAISVRTRDIYLLMITLALAMGVFRFVETNIAWFNGYEGIRNVVGPSLFGLPSATPWSSTTSPWPPPLRSTSASSTWCARPSAWCCRASATTRAAFRRWATRSRCTASPPSGSPLHRRLRRRPLHRLQHRHLARLHRPRRDGERADHERDRRPRHPAGAFIGSLIFTVFDTFAATIYDRDRFNTLIGLAFLAIVLVSPDGAIGIGARLRRLFGTRTTEERRPSAGKADPRATTRDSKGGNAMTDRITRRAALLGGAPASPPARFPRPPSRSARRSASAA